MKIKRTDEVNKELRDSINKLMNKKDEFEKSFLVDTNNFLKDKNESVKEKFTISYLLSLFYKYVGEIPDTRVVVNYKVNLQLEVLQSAFSFGIILLDKEHFGYWVVSNIYDTDILMESDDFILKTIERNLLDSKIYNFMERRIPSFFTKMEGQANNIFNIRKKEMDKISDTKSFITNYLK